MEEKVSTPHNNFVVVSQEDKNPVPSTADASPQIGLVQSSAIGEQSSANAMIGEKEIIIKPNEVLKKDIDGETYTLDNMTMKSNGKGADIFRVEFTKDVQE